MALKSFCSMVPDYQHLMCFHGQTERIRSSNHWARVLISISSVDRSSYRCF